MTIFIVVVLILAVIGGVAFAVFQEDQATDIVNKGLSFFEEKTSCNKVGDCITLKIPAEPDVPTQDSSRDSLPKSQQYDNQTFYENGTAIPESSYITGAVADTSYSKEGIKVSKYKEIENKMIVTRGNIASIEGQIKLVNEKGEIVEPRIYKYYLTIDCSELEEFCNLSPVSVRDTTRNGSFIYKWSTNFKTSYGLYVVSIMAESEQKDPYGQPYRVENQIFIEVV